MADCRFEAVPVIDEHGEVVGTEPNAKSRFYDVGDYHNDAPVGFSLRVNKRTKTYIVQVRQGAKVVTATLGRHPDLLIGKDVPPDRNARLLAAELSARIRRGEDVNEAKREARVAARTGRPTLRVLFEHWLDEYQSSAKRDPRPNTIAAVNKAMDRLGAALLDRDAADITWRDLEAFFKDKATKKGHLTAAEQTIRWVSTAYNRANLLAEAGFQCVELKRGFNVSKLSLIWGAAFVQPRAAWSARLSSSVSNRSAWGPERFARRAPELRTASVGGSARRAG